MSLNPGMDQLVPSTLRMAGGTNHPQVLFCILGIQHRAGRSFWRENEDQLHFLHHDLMKRMREVKAKLHPDAGGDAEQFRRFTDLAAQVERGFARRGIGIDPLGVAIRAEEQSRRDAVRWDAARARYIALNKDKIRAQQRNYYHENHEAIRAHRRAAYWRAKGVPAPEPKQKLKQAVDNPSRE